MKQVTVNVWCDSCQERGRKTPATTTPPLTVAGPARTLDLCDPCGKSLIRPLADLLDAYGVEYPAKDADASKGAPKGGTGASRPGVKAGGTRAPYDPGPDDKGKRLACPVPDCTAPAARDGSANFNGWGQHMRSRHGLQVAEVVEKYGRPTTLDGTPFEVTPLPPIGTPQDADPYACGYCDKAYPPDDYPLAWQALATHRNRRHGWFPGKLATA